MIVEGSVDGFNFYQLSVDFINSIPDENNIKRTEVVLPNGACFKFLRFVDNTVLQDDAEFPCPCNGMSILSIEVGKTCCSSYSRNILLSPTVNPTIFVPTESPTIKSAPICRERVGRVGILNPVPEIVPTTAPSNSPTSTPTSNPTLRPSSGPTLTPTLNPSNEPTTPRPTEDPTQNPTFNPTFNPSFNPTTQPSLRPTLSPTEQPTGVPTTNPSVNPTLTPTVTAPTQNPTSTPSDSPEVGFEPTLFPLETREGNNYIGLLFITEPSQEAFTAVLNAATIWSDIVAGSENVISTRNVNNACGFDFGFNILTDHLRIFFIETPIDGIGGIVANSNPCDLFAVEIPQFAQIGIDIDDVQNIFLESGQLLLEKILLQEVGHALGIGVLWRFFNLIRDPLPDDESNDQLPQPFYIGIEAVAQFSIIKGTPQVEIAVENGFNDVASPPGDLGIGPGEINIHFDKDALDNELMTFQVAVDSPLSIVSIGALADLGYVVNLGLADPFTDPFP